MKKTILILAFLIFAIFIFNNYINISGFATFKPGESKTERGRVITVENIAQNKVVIDIDGVSSILNKGETKEINGVEISVNEVFYVSEIEGRYADLAINVKSGAKAVCGDNICELDENYKNCCIDCECNKGYKCSNNICEKDLDECKKNKECDDNNEKTLDLCIGDPKKCVNKVPMQCTTNKECDDQNECTLDECKNNDCFNTKRSECKSKERVDEEGSSPATEEESGFVGNLIRKVLNIFGL